MTLFQSRTKGSKDNYKKADPFLEKYPSVRGDTHRDLERFPKVTFGSEPVHLKTGMHPGVSTLFQRRRRGPYI